MPITRDYSRFTISQLQFMLGNDLMMAPIYLRGDHIDESNEECLNALSQYCTVEVAKDKLVNILNNISPNNYKKEGNYSLRSRERPYLG